MSQKSNKKPVKKANATKKTGTKNNIIIEILTH
jgi:hypothetical protein